MARLSDAERKELLASGPALAKDMARLKKAAKGSYVAGGQAYLKNTMAFLNQMNELLGHPRKPFQPMDGDNFLL